MKRIAVIANEIEFANYIKDNLDTYFEDNARIDTYSTKEVSMMDSLDVEAVVLSAFTIFKKVKDKIKESSALQVISLTLSKDNVEVLKTVPKGSRALLANLDNRMCMQLITQIYEAGFPDLDLIPYYGDEENRDLSVRMAITPSEMQMVPAEIENVVNIGERVVDTGCIVELADKLGIKGIFNHPKAQKARNNIAVATWGVEKVLSENENVNDNIRALLEYIGDGIIITDNEGSIFLSNDKAQDILRGRSEFLDGFAIGDILPGIDLSAGEESVLDIDGKNIVLSVTDINADSVSAGKIITLKVFDEVEKKQHGIRNRIAGEQHVARFTFEDIKGESAEIKECVDIARRISKSDSSVLIIGDSGTGKEVFAQSVHNGSRRRDYNFVAVNCAAIPENLLESEMFGYEEGAFTGARKGGKIGYFELAHRGTIFLDEIGEMPLSLQSKLLRTLEEKKISKVGSSKLIDVDVRVIAATNRDLYELVTEKRFREDLYYRLNVLPLNIPALNDRGDDIILLFDEFMTSIHAEWKYGDNVKSELLRHQWKGNVREIRNIVEYLDSLGKAKVTSLDLPDNFRRTNIPAPKTAAPEKTASDGRIRDIEFILREGRNAELFKAILTLLDGDAAVRKNAGRLQIVKEIDEAGLYYTETEIRTALKKLSDAGFLKSQKGRGGTSITAKGRELAKELKGLLS